MNLVWEHSQAKAGARLVLLAVADHCNEEGIAWPSVDRLGRRANLGPRQCKRCLRELERLGELSIQRGKGPHHTHIYRVTICQGDNLPRVTSKAFGGDISGSQGVTRMTPNPSEETTKEPKEKKTRVSLSSSEPDSSKRNKAQEPRNASNGVNKG